MAEAPSTSRVGLTRLSSMVSGTTASDLDALDDVFIQNDFELDEDDEYEFLALPDVDDEFLEAEDKKDGVLSKIPFCRIHESPVSFADPKRRCFLPGQRIRIEIIDIEHADHLLNPNLELIVNPRWYVVQISHGDYEWVVRRRFKHFRSLHETLKMYRQRLQIPVPTKQHRERRKTYAARKQNLPKFPKRPDPLVRTENVDERKLQLKQYLEHILKSPIFRNHPETLQFMEVSHLSFVNGLGLKRKEGPMSKRTGGRKVNLTWCGCLPTIHCTIIWNTRWMILKDTCIAYMNPKSGAVSDVLLMDRDFRVTEGLIHTGVRHGLLVSNMSRNLLMKCPSHRASEEWCDEISEAARTAGRDFTTKNRHKSFAPERINTFANWYVDGASYMAAVADAMEGAKEEIFITDWWLSPEVYMKRPMMDGDKWRLDVILKRKAHQGVKIFIIVFKEMEMALGLNSFYTKQTLMALHPTNIKVMRHPDGISMFSHHEKIVCIDQRIAFLGGIDLCYGRWDTKAHRLTDLGSMVSTNQLAPINQTPNSLSLGMLVPLAMLMKNPMESSVFTYPSLAQQLEEEARLDSRAQKKTMDIPEVILEEHEHESPVPADDAGIDTVREEEGETGVHNLSMESRDSEHSALSKASTCSPGEHGSYINVGADDDVVSGSGDASVPRRSSETCVGGVSRTSDISKHASQSISKDGDEPGNTRLHKSINDVNASPDVPVAKVHFKDDGDQSNFKSSKDSVTYTVVPVDVHSGMRGGGDGPHVNDSPGTAALSGDGPLHNGVPESDPNSLGNESDSHSSDDVPSTNSSRESIQISSNHKMAILAKRKQERHSLDRSSSEPASPTTPVTPNDVVFSLQDVPGEIQPASNNNIGEITKILKPKPRGSASRELKSSGSADSNLSGYEEEGLEFLKTYLKDVAKNPALGVSVDEDSPNDSPYVEVGPSGVRVKTDNQNASGSTSPGSKRKKPPKLNLELKHFGKGHSVIDDDNIEFAPPTPPTPPLPLAFPSSDTSPRSSPKSSPHERRRKSGFAAKGMMVTNADGAQAKPTTPTGLRKFREKAHGLKLDIRAKMNRNKAMAESNLDKSTVENNDGSTTKPTPQDARRKSGVSAKGLAASAPAAPAEAAQPKPTTPKGIRKFREKAHILRVDMKAKMNRNKAMGRQQSVDVADSSYEHNMRADLHELKEHQGAINPDKIIGDEGLEGAMKLWIGKDYVNFIMQDFVELDDPFTDFIDRKTTPRMPWHDIAGMVAGRPARDVARHFIQRWNYTKLQKKKTVADFPMLLPKSYASIRLPTWVMTESFGCTAQILRSSSNWSAGIEHTESSIHNAYVDLIMRAKHYIYIENQFFVSIAEHKNVSNQVSYALYKRIMEAHVKKETFRVYVVMPLLPAFEGELGTGTGRCIQAVTHWNYMSICRGGKSLLERLAREINDPFDYITFFGLRSHTELEGHLVTELVYVHSKLMIVDDTQVIFGSANINDRSLLGNRDSEIAVLIEDTKMVPSVMNGETYQAGPYASSLRKNLFREHLGISETDLHPPNVTDPVHATFYKNVWLRQASINTSVFDKVFKCIPSDNVRTYHELHEYTKQLTLAQTNPSRAQKSLLKVKGYLVFMPLRFLEHEKLGNMGGSKEGLMPSYIWT